MEDFILLINEFKAAFSTFMLTSFDFFGFEIRISTLIGIGFACSIVSLVTSFLFGGRE